VSGAEVVVIAKTDCQIRPMPSKEIRQETLMLLDERGICRSAACPHQRLGHPSHVLEAMGLKSSARAACVLRLGDSTPKDADLPRHRCGDH
jgi:cysteine sulfinate desulfinase/cysteine desulfurase-like protein